MHVNNYFGLENSKEVSASYIDMIGNSILHTGTIYFQYQAQKQKEQQDQLDQKEQLMLLRK